MSGTFISYGLQFSRLLNAREQMSPNCYTVVSGADPMRNVSWILFQEGRSSELRLRRGVEQAAHTLNNPQVQCTGVLLCVIRE